MLGKHQTTSTCTLPRLRFRSIPLPSTCWMVQRLTSRRLASSRLAGWCHKRAFVTLGHNSLLSACPVVGHKGIAQYAPVGGRTMPESYGYVRISRPESRSCRAATRKPNASSCWLSAWRFLTSIRMSAAPVPAAGGAGTPWTSGWPRATPWLWCPSTASGGVVWTPWAISTTCNGAE